MKELLEFLNEHKVVEVILSRTLCNSSCFVVYLCNKDFLLHHFFVEDFEETKLFLFEHYKLVSLTEEIKFVPVEGDIKSLT